MLSSSLSSRTNKKIGLRRERFVHSSRRCHSSNTFHHLLLLTGCYSDTTIRTPEHQASVIELGRHLFYERRISLNNDRACGICHEQAKGFTDGFVRAIGTTGEVHPRNTHTVLNVESRNTLSWLHPETMTLSEHVLIPLLGTQPIEMGAQEKIQTMLAELNADPKYQALLGNVPGHP